MDGMLSENIKLTKAKDHSAAGTTAVNSDRLDMQGWDGVLLMTSFGTPASDNTVKAAQSDDDVTFADLAGTKVVSGASDEDVWIDLHRPQKRYVRLEAARGTSSTLESIWAVQYKGGRPGLSDLPQTNILSGTIIGERHQSPAEGTA